MSLFFTSNSTTLTSTEEAHAQQQASRILRVASFFTMTLTGFYNILFIGTVFLSALLTGDIFLPDLSTRAGLAYAGRLPTVAMVGFLGDGFSHVILFITS